MDLSSPYLKLLRQLQSIGFHGTELLASKEALCYLCREIENLENGTKTEIIPETFCLPAEMAEFLKRFESTESARASWAPEQEEGFEEGGEEEEEEEDDDDKKLQRKEEYSTQDETEGLGGHSSSGNSRNTWILKRIGLSRGNQIKVLCPHNGLNSGSDPGTHLASKEYILKHSRKGRGTVCSRYIDRPLQFRGRKFDIRVYVGVIAKNGKIAPQDVYLYREGFLRTALSPYQPPGAANADRVDVHLTNTFQSSRIWAARSRKDDQDNLDDMESTSFVEDPSFQAVYPLTEAFQEFDQCNHPSTSSDGAVADGAVADGAATDGAVADGAAPPSSTVLNSELLRSNLKQLLRRLFPMAIERINTKLLRRYPLEAHMLGFDVLYDERGKAWLLEVNQAPDMKVYNACQRPIKENLLLDFFRLIFPTCKEWDDAACLKYISNDAKFRELVFSQQQVNDHPTLEGEGYGKDDDEGKDEGLDLGFDSTKWEQVLCT